MRTALYGISLFLLILTAEAPLWMTIAATAIFLLCADNLASEGLKNGKNGIA